MELVDRYIINCLRIYMIKPNKKLKADWENEY